MIHQLESLGYHIEIGNICESQFLNFLIDKKGNPKYQHFILLVDENTQTHCLEYILTNFDVLASAEIITIPAGEESKSLEISAHIWSAFQEYKITRNALLINLGGGVVTDLGGFIASIYKRGIDYINVPTSLLGMIDASVGGKTGIDFNGIKNDLGLFSTPQFIICDPIFLSTLSSEEFLSGKAEMLKHGIISSKQFWKTAKNCTSENISALDIKCFIEVKNTIVQRDFKEENERKKLNVGHTIGHALESFFLEQSKPVTHGNCVAWGIVVEAFLAYHTNHLSEKDFSEIKNTIQLNYPKLEVSATAIEPIMQFMKNDKKNQEGKINFNLIRGFGDIVINHDFSNTNIQFAIEKILCSD